MATRRHTTAHRRGHSRRTVTGHRKGRHGHGLPFGFVSKKQMRYFYANPYLRERFAHKESHKAGMFSAITKVIGYSPRYRALPLYERHGVAIPGGTSGGGHTAAGRRAVRRHMPTRRGNRRRA